MKQTKITFNLDGLEDMKKKIGNTYRTRVGFLGGKAITDHGSLTNAELALIHIFGSLTNNLPARDMLLMPIEKNRRELIGAISSGQMKAAFESGDYKKMFQLLGVKAEEFVQMAFDTGGFGLWAPLKPATIKAKGSSAILIHFAQLRRAVSSDVVEQSGHPQVSP